MLVDPALLLSFLFVLARVGAAFSFVPLPVLRNTTEMLRAVLVLAITVALFPVWPAVTNAGDYTIGRLAATMLSEAAFGITMGVAVSFLTEAFLLGAQLMGLQAGFSYASTIDPTSQADSTVFQMFAQLAAFLLFFSAGIDREIIRAFAKSLDVFPPGEFAVNGRAAIAIVELGAWMLAFGVRLALPVIALLALTDITLGLMGRVNAHLQLLSLAFPAKMLVALVLTAALLTIFPALFHSAAQRTLSVLLVILRG